MCDSKALTKVESDELEFHVERINCNSEIMADRAIESAESIQIIKEKKLYRKYGTWEQFCEKRLQKSKQHVDRLLRHAKTLKTLEDHSKNGTQGSVLSSENKEISSVIPKLSERATRELRSEPIEKQLEIVTKASQNGTKTPTAKEIKAVKEDAKPQVEPTANPTQETETVTILKTEYDELRSTKNSQPPKNCPHCRKDTTKPPVKQEVKQVFERSSAKSEMDDFFSKTA